MFSRIGRVIIDHREQIGIALVGIGFFWMMGVAGTDDYHTEIGIYDPLLPLVIKSALGLLVMGLGVVLLNYGGEHNESDL